MTREVTQSWDVIVVGAGVAGLTAARTLAEAGLRVALLEARERIGGRIHTVAAADGGLPIELGAEFIHGLAPELIGLVDEAGLTRFELEGDVRCSSGTKMGPCRDQDEMDHVSDILSPAELPPEDLSFNEYVARRGLGAKASAWATSYVEGFNAADADRISIHALAKQQAAEDNISGDRGFRVMEGYGRVPAFLLRRFAAAGGQLFPSSAARSIRWKPGQVEITTASERVFQARSVVLTLPLGVLQARSVVISPAPERIFSAVDQMAMGHAFHQVFEFDSTFLSAYKVLQGVSFVLAPEVMPPTWWTSHPVPAPMLTGWVAGRKTKSIEIADLPETSLGTLADLLGTPLGELRRHLVRWHLHDWSADVYSLGAYSYVPKGALHASDEMAVPVENTLFFAGEHTDTSGHWGTVHGALRSGCRAAAQVLAAASYVDQAHR